MDDRPFGASVVSANQSKAERWRISSFLMPRVGLGNFSANAWIGQFWIVINFARIRLVHEFLFSIEFVFSVQFNFNLRSFEFDIFTSGPCIPDVTEH